MNELKRDEAEVEQRFCLKCGAELKKEASFCTSCGTRISEKREHPRAEYHVKHVKISRSVFILIIIIWIIIWIIIGMKSGCQGPIEIWW
jgi:uncharacterized membrane protein YvbJ